MAGTTNTGEVRPQGRYVLGELLGRGGMAKVFAGHAVGSHGFQKPVAIKRLLPELATDNVFVERLIGEAKLLVGMQHGNIVSVLDLCRDGDDVLLVMEFVDGPSLRQLLKARGTRGLPFGVATYVVQAAAAGLEFAHVRPGGAVIHADISPSNLLLTTSGEVRVADFGIARREGVGAGIVEGKWAYMAPEQARGEPLTPRCDVFALGVVLYELITGCHPFGAQVTAEQRASQPLRVMSPRSIRSEIPVGLDAICMRALADDPRARYARMQDMIDALVDERFANAWREGASELAHVIREATLGVAPTEQRTRLETVMTINTRSLISVSSAPRMRFAEGTRPPQNTPRATSVVELIARGSAPALSEREPESAPNRWATTLFAGAAVLGAVAALALRIGGSGDQLAAAPMVAQAEAAAPAPAAVVEVTPLPMAPPPAPAPTSAPEPVAAVPAVHAAPRPHVVAPKHETHDTQTLRVRTSDGAWATVSIAGQGSQEAPGATFHLAPGHYAVKLENDSDGVRHCSITIEAGHNATLAVDMQRRSDACWVE